jgi:putative FmdB family regulatory protein
MPIYEYRRPDGTTFELQQSFSEDALKVDPDTGVPVERVLHAPAVHFKGKGFYNTDYGTRNRQRESAANSEKASAEKSSSSEKSGGGGEKSGSSSGSGDSSSSSSSSSSEGKSSDKGSSSSGSGSGGKSTGDSRPVAAKG